MMCIGKLEEFGESTSRLYEKDGAFVSTADWDTL